MKRVNFIEAESLPSLARKVNTFLQEANRELVDVKAQPVGSSYFCTLLYKENAEDTALKETQAPE